MHICYSLSQAKQIVWHGYHYRSSFGKHSYGAELGAGTGRGQESCDLVLALPLTLAQWKTRARTGSLFHYFASEIRLMIS